MIIACDADGVICDLHAEWLRRYNRDYHDGVTVEDILSWDMHKYVKPECGKKIYDYLHEPDLYARVAPIAGALEGITQLRSLGHTVYFITACTYGMTDQKARWFEQHGFCKSKDGRSLPAEFVPMIDKNLLDARLLIDDAAHNVRQWIDEKHRPAILLNQPYNVHLDNDVPSAFWMTCHRARNWNDVVRIIATMSQPVV